MIPETSPHSASVCGRVCLCVTVCTGVGVRVTSKDMVSEDSAYSEAPLGATPANCTAVLCPGTSLTGLSPGRRCRLSGGSRAAVGSWAGGSSAPKVSSGVRGALTAGRVEGPRGFSAELHRRWVGAEGRFPGGTCDGEAVTGLTAFNDPPPLLLEEQKHAAKKQNKHRLNKPSQQSVQAYRYTHTIAYIHTDVRVGTDA